jgi:ketopantoate hydroxymethyltransferase
VRQYAKTHETLVQAVRDWADDVRTGRFPSEAESYGIPPEVLAEVREHLG